MGLGGQLGGQLCSDGPWLPCVHSHRQQHLDFLVCNSLLPFVSLKPMHPPPWSMWKMALAAFRSQCSLTLSELIASISYLSCASNNLPVPTVPLSWDWQP